MIATVNAAPAPQPVNPADVQVMDVVLAGPVRLALHVAPFSVYFMVPLNELPVTVPVSVPMMLTLGPAVCCQLPLTAPPLCDNENVIVEAVLPVACSVPDQLPAMLVGVGAVEPHAAPSRPAAIPATSQRGRMRAVMTGSMVLAYPERHG